MTRPRREVLATRGEFVEAPVDWAVAALAERQHGVVARAQLRSLGLSDAAIDRRAAAGRLHRMHRGVYAVGHRVLARRGHWMAAVLACGRGAALSHSSAGALWELRASAAIEIDVTVRTPGGRGREGLRIHRVPTLRPGETTTHDGIAVTTPARTILDLAGTTKDPRRLERLLDQAEIQRLTDSPSLAALARAHPNHPGTKRLTTALRTHVAGTTATRSELEERFLALCATHGLPRPAVNDDRLGFQVDFLLPAARLVVETDGWAFHRTRARFEEDRARDAAIACPGHRTLRFTHRQVIDQEATVLAALRAALRGR